MAVALVPLTPVVCRCSPVSSIAPVGGHLFLLLLWWIKGALDDDGGGAGCHVFVPTGLRSFDWLLLPLISAGGLLLRACAAAAGTAGTLRICCKGRQRVLLYAHLSVHFRCTCQHAAPLQGGGRRLPALQEQPQGALHLPSQPEACQLLRGGLGGSLPCCQSNQQKPVLPLLPGGFVPPVPRCRCAVHGQC